MLGTKEIKVAHEQEKLARDVEHMKRHHQKIKLKSTKQKLATL